MQPSSGAPIEASPGGGASPSPALKELARRVRAGEPASIARAITLCELGGDRAGTLLRLLPRRSGHVVGITGSSGAGKSTLVSAIIRRCREAGRTVGVVAVDPSSPITGGALLADRVRLDGVQPGDRGVFFRSLGSRGASGGLSDAARSATQLLCAAGFDLVLLETVGAGQAEVRVVRVADTVVVVMIPGAGDEMQALKAGMMEIADLFDINKVDLPGAIDLRRHVKAMLGTREPADWSPPIIETVADQGDGIDGLLDAVRRHRLFLDGGAGVLRDQAGVREEALGLARRHFDRALKAVSAGVLHALSDAEIDEYEAAIQLASAAAQRLTDDLVDR